MVGDMENFKIRVTTEQESKEVQELFFELGYGWHGKGKLISYLDKILSDDFGWLVLWKPSYLTNTVIQMGSGFESCKEITLPHLIDLVVLKRNSIDDASFKDTFGDIWYVDSTNNYWMFENDIWREAEKPLFKLEQIKKEGEVKMKEYLDTNYELRSVKQTSGDNHVPNGRIEVPEGAEIFLSDESCGKGVLYFVKHDGDVFHEYYISGTDIQNNTWIKGTIKELHKDMGEVLWERSLTKTDTSTQEKLKFIEKWLNGEKIQYILGDVSEKTQWHNFTEGAMQYIKRSDIKLRAAPKYVTINGIEFKSVEKLVKYVKNNFDLENEE